MHIHENFIRGMRNYKQHISGELFEEFGGEGGWFLGNRTSLNHA